MAPKGSIKVQVFKGEDFVPIENSKVTIIETGESAPARQGEKVINTDSSGLTQEIDVNTPPVENSMNPGDKLPYSFVDIKVEYPGFNTIVVKGCQIYPDRVAFQQFNMIPVTRGQRQTEQVITVSPNTLVGKYPPKIPEDPNKPLPPPPSGFVVLEKPVVPQYITVHSGVPDDNTAPNYTVRFKEYVKNVASSEIFPTWPETAIRANIYCIISFALNRVYTEWYRSKGKDFQITNNTAFDQAFTYGRNIYDNIDRIVDELFSTYVKRVGRKQPLLTQYCDGINVQCPGWLTQWGSKYLGDQGKTPYEILTNFYGSDIGLETAETVKGIPTSYPGYILSLGSTGMPVRDVQRYLNRISENYPAIPKQAVDGVYGMQTRNAVIEFQKIFNLPPTGTVDYATWYKISEVYVGVTKIGELRSYKSKKKIFYPPIDLSMYQRGDIPYIFYEDDM